MKKFTHRFVGNLEAIKNLPASGGAIILQKEERGSCEQSAKTASNDLPIDLKKNLQAYITLVQRDFGIEVNGPYQEEDWNAWYCYLIFESKPSSKAIQALQHNFDKYFKKYPEETIKFYVVDFSKETPGKNDDRKIKIM